MFMFVMLVALGMDYNIFLIGRVKEEVAVNGTRAGTRHALARTGGIITSAGIIMAGTFASMMSASLLGLLQIGFAVAFGVLLDTFVVRPLVPAIIVLLGRWSWWPRRPSGAPQDTSPEADEQVGAEGGVRNATRLLGPGGTPRTARPERRQRDDLYAPMAVRTAASVWPRVASATSERSRLGTRGGDEGRVVQAQRLT